MPDTAKTVRLLSDFDGTLTGVEGQDAFNTKLPARIDAAGADENQVLETIRQHIEKNPEFGISKKGVDFIRNILANPDAELVIVSRNFTAYVKAVLKIAGFKDADIQRIAIYDRRSFKTKGDAVRAHEQTAGVTPITIVCDDSNKDCQDMFNSTKSEGKLQYNSPMGKFDWPDITLAVRAGIANHSPSKTAQAPPIANQDGDERASKRQRNENQEPRQSSKTDSQKSSGSYQSLGSLNKDPSVYASVKIAPNSDPVSHAKKRKHHTTIPKAPNTTYQSLGSLNKDPKIDDNAKVTSEPNAKKRKHHSPIPEAPNTSYQSLGSLNKDPNIYASPKVTSAPTNKSKDQDQHSSKHNKSNTSYQSLGSLNRDSKIYSSVPIPPKPNAENKKANQPQEQQNNKENKSPPTSKIRQAIQRPANNGLKRSRPAEAKTSTPPTKQQKRLFEQLKERSEAIRKLSDEGPKAVLPKTFRK